MNTKRYIKYITATVVVVMLLFPPWVQERHIKYGVREVHEREPLGYQIVISPPVTYGVGLAVGIDFQRLILQLAIVGVVSFMARKVTPI